jgi:hypothetical protein
MNDIIPMFITITKPNVPKYETTTIICLNLEDVYNKLIVNFKKSIDKNIDYPSDVDDFVTNFWYNENAMDNEFFDYNIFYENKWQKPWTLQELYDNAINIIIQVDIQNSIYNNRNYYDYCSDSEDEKIDK